MYTVHILSVFRIESQNIIVRAALRNHSKPFRDREKLVLWANFASQLLGQAL